MIPRLLAVLFVLFVLFPIVLTGCHTECDKYEGFYGVDVEDTALPADNEEVYEFCMDFACAYHGAVPYACDSTENYEMKCTAAGYYDDCLDPEWRDCCAAAGFDEDYYSGGSDDPSVIPDCPVDLYGTWESIVGSDLYDASDVASASCLARNVELSLSFVGSDATRDAVGVFTGDGTMSSDFVSAVDSYDDGFSRGYLVASGIYTASGTVEVDLFSSYGDAAPIATLTGTFTGVDHMELEVAGDPFDAAACLDDVRYPILYFHKSGTAPTSLATTVMGAEIIPCETREVSATAVSDSGFSEADFQFFLGEFKKVLLRESLAERHAAVATLFAGNEAQAHVANVELIPGAWTFIEVTAHQIVDDMATQPHLREVIMTVVKRYNQRETTGYRYEEAVVDIGMAVDKMFTQRQKAERQDLP